MKFEKNERIKENRKEKTEKDKRPKGTQTLNK